MSKPHQLAIVWFRRDLRVTDQRALDEALAASEKVVPIYVTSTWQNEHRWTGPKRQSFLCGCLASLAGNVEALGGKMLFRAGQAEIVLRKLVEESGATAIYFNRDYDPFGRETEEKIASMADELGIEIHSFKDIVLHERDEILTKTGGPYRVYTPYSRSWFDAEKSAPKRAPRAIPTPDGLKSDPVPTLKHWKLPEPDATILEPGEKAARARLKELLKKDSRLEKYAEQRDTPGIEGTSRLSQDLRFGLISPRELYARAAAAKDACKSAAASKGWHVFLKEVAWRDFYQQLLWHFPEVFEHEFNPVWRGLPWSADEDAFTRWKEGKTGFPIVDAGMRQLRATGFMHNRVRMITSMFLTKDLHIDWRWGESYFMQQLVDGDNASNNGGWQWSAGTGADAAPYFRIQNPWTQTKRYDPEGLYVKQWVPELAEADAKALYTEPPEGESVWIGYPPPMVDHSTERNRTLEIFKKHREQMEDG